MSNCKDRNFFRSVTQESEKCPDFLFAFQNTLVLPVFAQNLQGFLHALIGGSHNLIILLRVPNIAGNQRLDLQEQELFGVGKLLVVPIHFGFRGDGFQSVNKVLTYNEILVEVVEVAVLRPHFFAVLEAVIGGEAVQGTFADEVGVELAVVGRVDRDEEVGHDAATAVNGATSVCLKLQGIREVDAVGVIVFAVFETFGHLLGIVLNTFFVRPLDACGSARW